MTWITIMSSTAGIVVSILYWRLVRQSRKMALEMQRRIMVLELYLDTLEKTKGIRSRDSEGGL